MAPEFRKFLYAVALSIDFFLYPFGGTPNICTRGRMRSPFAREGAPE
jgi:hypothetical protein